MNDRTCMDPIICHKERERFCSDVAISINMAGVHDIKYDIKLSNIINTVNLICFLYGKLVFL